MLLRVPLVLLLIVIAVASLIDYHHAALVYLYIGVLAVSVISTVAFMIALMQYEKKQLSRHWERLYAERERPL
jgi:hypothetical protein